MFSLDGAEILHKAVAKPKTESTPRVAYDLQVAVRTKSGTGEGTDKKAVVTRTFHFTKGFIHREQLDNKFKSDAVKGTILDGDKFPETFALTVLTKGGQVYLVKVSEQFAEIHAFAAVEGTKPKLHRPTMSTVAEHLVASGLMTGEIGESAYFTLEAIKNEDGSDFSQGEYLKVFEFKKVDVNAPAPKAEATAAKVESAPATEESEDDVILEDEPAEEEEDDDELVD